MLGVEREGKIEGQWGEMESKRDFINVRGRGWGM